MTGGSSKFNFMDNKLISVIKMIPYIKVVIILLIFSLLIIYIMSRFKIKKPVTGAGVARAIGNIKKMNRYDRNIMRAEKSIAKFKNFVNKTPFRLADHKREYWQYNIDRIGWKIPGGKKELAADELNGIIVTIGFGMFCVSMLVLIILNISVGLLLVMTTILCTNILPMLYIRLKVAELDKEISDNFLSMYLMLHYTLLQNAGTSIKKILLGYKNTTHSKEMHKFIEKAVYNIDTFGSMKAPDKIAEAYREIPEVRKLMRLLVQVETGGDVKAELMGFHKELTQKADFIIQDNKKKLLIKLDAVMMLMYPLIGEAVILAMSVYFKDMGSMFSIF